ncbi:MAG TPA: hypothetical protein P5571_09875 [Candidatus Krumholzibacteria bacterium]|nr:hypothetical protein [Candidatus Krumholzibacteria bacterium]HRX51661.1 hypothetical protein [Candidatus Krumholzibacteria bacterium]
MEHITREEGHLLVAAVRILSHLRGSPPTVEAVAELLRWAPESVRMKTVLLHELGALALVDSAYDHHLEVRDHARLETLTPEADHTGMDEALADFDRRKEEEQRRMSQLFGDGDHERRRRERIQAMEDGLFGGKPKKPRNPFGDDD